MHPHNNPESHGGSGGPIDGGPPEEPYVRQPDTPLGREEPEPTRTGAPEIVRFDLRHARRAPRARRLGGVAVSPPETNPAESPEAVRPRLGPAVTVDKLQEPLPAEERDTAASDTRPDPSRIGQAIHAGRPIARLFSWIGGRAKAQATPEMAPPTATTRETPEPEVANAEADRSRMSWVRLRGTVAVTPNNSTADTANTPTRQTRMGEVVNTHRSTDFTVAVVAEGISPEEQDRVIRAEVTAAQNAERSAGPTATVDGVRHTTNAATYEASRVKGIAREVIAVGTADPEALEAVAETVARNIGPGHQGARPLQYEVERNADGTPMTHPSLDVAVSTARGDAAPVVTAEEIAGHAELPDEPLAGLGRTSRQTNFDVERELPPGVPAVTVGETLDNRGNPTGRPLRMTREHIAVIAETEAGKSAFLRRLGVDIQGQNLDKEVAARAVARAAAEAAGVEFDETAEVEYDHEALVYFDCKNQHEFTDKFSREIGGATGSNGEPMPEEMATVHHAAPGGRGPGIRFNLLRPARNDADSEAWRKRIDTAQEVATAKYKNQPPETYNAVKKWFGNVVDKGCEAFGLDPNTGRSRYPGRTPATPTGEFMENLVEGAGDDIQLKGEYRNNVIGWVKSEIGAMFRGDNGAPLAATGYRFNAMAALKNKGVTSIDLANMRDGGARQVAVLAGLYDLYDGCRAMNAQEGIQGSTDKIRVTVVIDEADIFTPDGLGGSIADFLTHARHAGMRIVFAKQGDIDGSIHKQVWINTPNKVMLRTGHVQDRAAFAGSAGRTTVEDMEFLPGAEKGEFVYKGPGMARAVRGRVYNPNDPRVTPLADTAHVVDCRALIDLDGDPEPFDQSLRGEAVAFLHDKENKLGAHISNWAEVNAIFLASGRPITDVEGDLEMKLYTKIQTPAERDKVRCAIVEAIDNAVNSRHDIQWVADRIDYKTHLVKHMLAIADGERLEGWDQPRPDLALVAVEDNKKYDPGGDPKNPNTWRQFNVLIDGKFGMVKDDLNAKMTPDRHERSAEFSEALGRNILGVTAHEELDAVKRFHVEANSLVAEAIVQGEKSGAATGSGMSGVGTKLEQTIAALVAGHLDEVIGTGDWEQVRARACEVLRDKISLQSRAELKSGQIQKLQAIVSAVSDDSLKATVGYDTVEQVYETMIDEFETATPPIAASEVEQLCGATVRDMIGGHTANGSQLDLTEVVGLYNTALHAQSAKEQREAVEKLEQLHAATLPYAEDIIVNRIWCATDTRRAGVTLDNNNSNLQQKPQNTGPMYESARAKAGYTPQADNTLGAQIAGDKYNDWKRSFSNNITYNDDFGFSNHSARVRFLVRGFGLVLEGVYNELEELREIARKQKAEAKA